MKTIPLHTKKIDKPINEARNQYEKLKELDLLTEKEKICFTNSDLYKMAHLKQTVINGYE